MVKCQIAFSNLSRISRNIFIPSNKSDIRSESFELHMHVHNKHVYESLCLMIDVHRGYSERVKWHRMKLCLVLISVTSIISVVFAIIFK